MIIYEVNLVINSEIYAQFDSWLKEHAREMLQFPGFIKAQILKPKDENTSGQEKLTVQYQVENQESLDIYFKQYAAKMREDGLARFKDQFSAERRILEVREDISK